MDIKRDLSMAIFWISDRHSVITYAEQLKVDEDGRMRQLKKEALVICLVLAHTLFAEIGLLN